MEKGSGLNQKKRVVLSVDSDHISHDVIEQFLRKINVTFLRALSGDEALELLRKEHVDLVLTTTRLPMMSGLELARHIRNPAVYSKFYNNSSSIPIIALHSSYTFDILAREITGLGINDHLAIPVDRNEFVNKVESLLNSLDLE